MARAGAPADGAAGDSVRVIRATVAAMCAVFVGIGLLRFSYTPLIPALIGAGWFAPGAAAYLGAANLAGYLAGALLGRRLAAWAGTVTVLRGAMVAAVVSLLACAWPSSFLWFFVWRLVSGIVGGVLMVLAAPSVLPHLPPARRGIAGGAIFAGVGLGVAASGTLVPALIRWNLTAAWLGLGGLALVLTTLAWGGWPRACRAGPAPAVAHVTRSAWQPALAALYVAYGLNAVGLVPHMVFLVDFIARGLGQGLDAGAGYWVLFGASAVAGPILAGHLGDRIGFGMAMRLALVVQAATIGLLAVTATSATLIVSTMVAGALAPGIVPLALGRIHELLPHDGQAQAAAWSLCTVAFALGQAAAAYGFSFIFAEFGDYEALFALGAAALVVALAIDIAGARLRSVAATAKGVPPAHT